MAGSLPGIVVKVAAQTKDAIDGLNKVNRALGSAGSTSARVSQQFSVLKPAIAGAAAAFGLMAIKVGTDAVQAAIEEEQSVGRLTTTMRNLGLATQDADVEQFIDNMQFATGVADNQMRPAYDRLIRSIGDVGEANQALALSLDIAVAKGRDVQQVADVMGKAYDGNTMALSRMGVGIDRAILKTGDMARITSALTDKFGGQANAAANTLGGAMKGVQIGWDELVESFGQGLVGSTSGDIAELQRLQTQLRDMQPAAARAGEALHNMAVGGIGFVDRISAMNDALENHDWSQAWAMIKAGASDDDEAFARIINDYRTADYVAESWQDEMGRVHSVLRSQAVLARQAASATDEGTSALERQDAAAKRLKDSLDVVNGRNRSVLGARLSLRGMRRQGIQGTGAEVTRTTGGSQWAQFGLGGGGTTTTTNKVTRDDALAYGLQYAQGVEQLVTSMRADGAGVQKIAATFEQQRAALADTLRPVLGKGGTQRFLSNYLSTPDYIQAGANAAEWRGSMRDVFGNQPTRGGTMTYIDKVIVQADSPAEAERKLKDWQRYKRSAPSGAVTPFG
jgi:hypothetical protein